jgi:PAS domain S-box-containing protein
MSESPRSKTHVQLEDSIPQASLESILCTEELHRRPWRSPDYERENRALVVLVHALADSPRTVLQTLAETILDITQCDSAGLSLLTRDGKTPDVSGTRFYWPAIAGMWNPHVGGGTPRNFGPCGDVLDQNRTLLFRHFERRYAYLLPVIPAAEECLLVPFHVHGKAVGTIWAIMHSDRCKFDAEDDRVMASLGKFASSAYQALVSIDELKFQVAEREKAETELREITDGLEEQVRARTTELQRSEERLRLAQQAARIGTFEWNIQTGVNTWTPELEEMYGLHPGGFGGTQTAFENLVHPDDRAGVIELVDWALKTGLPAKGEWRVVWPDGSVHWIAGRWRVFMNESGEPSRMIGVNTDVTERKLAEEALRESEQRLRLATQAGRMYAYDWDVTKDVVVRSSEHVKILGLTEPLRFPQQQFVDKIHPDDRPKFLATVAGLTPENPTGEVTYRALASDGSLVWLKSNGRGFFDAEGKLLRVIGMVADVTDIKRAEEALVGMTRKLIDSQEHERARIGRELHDDINQRLALLAIELEQLQKNPSEVESRLQELREETIEIANDVQALSHELHSSKLEILGVVAGIRGWCREFGERQRVEIDFKSEVYSVLPFEIGLCLLRVLQEALHNAIKHSGVKRVGVQIEEHSNTLHLIVSDSGKGFDVEAAKLSRGLGLTSMQERVRLVNGTIAIDSKPMGGTTIHVRVPFRSERLSEQAVG